MTVFFSHVIMMIDKEVNALEWLKQMMDAVEYMEGHIENLLMFHGCKSSIHLLFTFKDVYMLTGTTVAEYLRKRRLTLAAQELAQPR